MKKIIIAAALAILPFITSAQTTAFDKFENVEGIETVSINKKMFEMLGNVETSAGGEKTQKLINMAEGLDYLKVFTTSEKKHRKDLVKAVGDYLKQNKLDELISVNDKGAKVKIYVNQGNDASVIKEGLLFVEDLDDKEVVVVSFAGNINLQDIENLKK